MNGLEHDLSSRYEFLPESNYRREEAKDIERLSRLGFSEELGMTFEEATRERYRQHLAACQTARMKPERFGKFASEVVDCPSDAVRVSILKPEPLPEPYEGWRHFEQYTSPGDFHL